VRFYAFPNRGITKKRLTTAPVASRTWLIRPPYSRLCVAFFCLDYVWLPTSAGRHSEVGQRVVGALGRAAATELDVPGERCRSLSRIKRHCHGVPKPRERVDALREPDQHQRVVAERQVMTAVVEDVERDLSRRLGIDDHIPIPGDRGPGNRRAATLELAARKRAMERLSGRGRRPTR